MALGAAVQGPSREESLVNNSIDTFIKGGYGWDQMRNRLDQEYLQDVWEPIYNKRRAETDAGAGIVPDLTEDQIEEVDAQAVENRSEIDDSWLEGKLGARPKGVVTDAMRWANSEPQAPVQPLPLLKVSPGSKGELGEPERYYDPSMEQSYMDNAEGWNMMVERSKSDFEDYQLSLKQERKWVNEANTLLTSENQRRQEDKLDELYYRGVEYDQGNVDQYVEALEAGDLSQEQFDAALKSINAQPQSFTWNTFRGEKRNKGNMHIGDTGYLQISEELQNLTPEEKEARRSEDPTYVSFMGENLFGYDESPLEIINRFKKNFPGKSNAELLSNERYEDYRKATQEFVRRSSQYDTFYMSSKLRDYMLENTFEGQDKSQLAAAEQHVFDQFGIRVDLTSDNQVGVDNKGVIGDLLVTQGIGGVNTATSLMGNVSAFLDFFTDAFGMDEADFSEGAKAFYNLAQNELLPDLRNARNQYLFTRDLYGKFGESPLANADDIANYEISALNALAVLVGGGDSFARQEFMESQESTIQNTYNRAVGLTLTGGRTLSGFGKGVFGTGKALGLTEASAGIFGGVSAYGQKYLEITSDPKISYLYNNYTLNGETEMSPSDARSMLVSAQFDDPSSTYESIGIDVEKNSFRIYGHAIGEGLAEGVPEVGMNLLSSYFFNFGNGTISELGSKRLLDLAGGYLLSQSVNILEEGLTEWITGVSQRYVDAVVRGEDPNWGGIFEESKHDFLMGAYMAPLGGAQTTAIGAVRQEKMIADGLKNNPLWVKSYNLNQIYRNKVNKLSDEAKEIANNNKQLMSTEISESYRASLERRNQELYNNLSNKNKAGVREADALLRNHESTALSILAVNGMMQRASAEYAEAGKIEDEETRSMAQEQIKSRMESLASRFEELETEAAELLKTPVKLVVRDGQGNQSDVVMTSRPLSPREESESSGLTSMSDEETASLQNESEREAREYDDDLDSQIEKERSALIILGASADGSLMTEGSVDESLYQEGVLELMKVIAPGLTQNATVVAHASNEAFDNDPEVVSEMQRRGLTASPNAMAVIDNDGNIQRIIIKPGTSQAQAMHELAHGSLREVFNNNEHRKELVRQLVSLGNRRGNSQLGAWLDSTLVEYELTSEQLNEAGNPDISKLTAEQQEELIVGFLTSVSSNKWEGTGGLDISFEGTRLESLSSSFWQAVGSVSPLAKKLRVGNRAGLGQVASRFKAAMPKAKRTSVKDVIAPGVTDSTVTKDQEAAPLVSKKGPSTVGEVLKAAEDSQEVKVSPDVRSEDVGRGVTPVVEEKEDKKPFVSEPQSDTESDAEYSSRLEREASDLLGDLEGLSTPETDAMSQETEGLTGNVLSRQRERRQDWLSGKKVKAVYRNKWGHARVFEMVASDYFHFRNWHNKVTGNGIQPFESISYTDDKGNKRVINPPKPRTDRQGNAISMKPTDIRLMDQKFADSKRAMGRAKKRSEGERSNRFERISELLKENNLTHKDIGISPFVGGSTYAQLEEAEVNLQAMISEEPGSTYPLGPIVPDMPAAGLYGEMAPDTWDNYVSGRKKGYLSVNRDKPRRVIKGKNGKFIATQNRRLNVSDAINDGAIELHPTFVEFLKTLDPETPVFAVVEKYAPIEPSEVEVLVGGKMVSFSVEGGAFAPVVDFQDKKRDNGFAPGTDQVAAIANSKKGQRNRAFNVAVTQSLEFESPVSGNIPSKAIILIKDLAEDNPLGDKSVADGIFAMMEEFASQGDDQALLVASSLNSALASTFSKGRGQGSIKIERGQDVYEVADDEQLQAVGFAVEGTNANPTLRIDVSSPDIAREGVSKFRELFINFRGKNYIQEVDNISFDTRKNIVSHALLQKNLGGKKATTLGFPSQELILDIVGVEESSSKESGADISYAIEIDINNAKKGQFPSSKGRQYNHYVSGFNTLHVFDSPVSETEVKKRMVRVDAQEGTETFGGAVEAMASGYKGRLMSRNRAGRIYHHGASWEKSTETGYGRALSSIALKLQDKYFDVVMLQDDVENFKNSKLAEGQDFDLGVDLMYGRAAYRLERLEEAQQQLKDRMDKFGIKSDDLSTYLYAKHAKERNRQINRLNPDQLSGSGQTNKWATDTVSRLETSEMKQLAEIVYSIIANTRKTMVEYGLEPQQKIDAWTELYDFYVPLGGLATDELDENNMTYPTGGAGMAVYGSLIRKAKGRKSEVTVNVIAQVIMQNAMVIQAAEKNKALQRLHGLVKNNPNQKVWAIVTSKNPLTALDDNGLPRQMTVAEMQKNPHLVPVRIDGKQEFIYFKSKSYANTLNGATVERAGFITRSLNSVTGWLRNMLTIYDPNFFISNFAKDFQTAIPNAIAEAEMEGGNIEGIGNVMEFTGKVMNNIQKSLRSLFKNAAFGKDMDPMIEEYHREWEAAGGKTGWGYTKDIPTLISELEKKSGAKGALEYLMGSPKKFATFVEGINDSFEQATRLGAYIAARQMGVSVERAAQLSKNVTVNFNRGGEWQFLNATYLFFNAAMQGNARLFRTMFYMKDVRKENGELDTWHKRVSTPQKIAFGMATFSGLMTMINLAMSGSDDEGDGEMWYNKISDYEKERNLIFMHTDGKNYTKVPLPYGYNIFNNMGLVASEVTSGNREMWDGLSFLLNSAFSSFSPISFGQSDDAFTYTTKAVAPTIVKPIVEIAANETYFGSNVYTDRLPFDDTPYSQLAFRSPEFLREFFEWINEASGGSKYTSGDYDYNPDMVWYLFEFFIGSAGRFVGNTGELAKNMYEMSKNSYAIAQQDGLSYDDWKNITAGFKNESKIKMEPNSIPLVRKIYGSPSKYFDQDLFRNNAMKIKQLNEEMDKSLRRDDPNRYAGVRSLYSGLININKRLKTIRSRRRLIRDKMDISYTERSNQLKDLEEMERLLMAQFNGRYEKLRQED